MRDPSPMRPPNMRDPSPMRPPNMRDPSPMPPNMQDMQRPFRPNMQPPTGPPMQPRDQIKIAEKPQFMPAPEPLVVGGKLEEAKKKLDAINQNTLDKGMGVVTQCFHEEMPCFKHAKGNEAEMHKCMEEMMQKIKERQEQNHHECGVDFRHVLDEEEKKIENAHVKPEEEGQEDAIMEFVAGMMEYAGNVMERRVDNRINEFIERRANKATTDAEFEEIEKRLDEVKEEVHSHFEEKLQALEARGEPLIIERVEQVLKMKAATTLTKEIREQIKEEVKKFVHDDQEITDITRDFAQQVKARLEEVASGSAPAGTQ